MKQTDALATEQIDAQRNAQAMKDREELWRCAEGRLGVRGLLGSVVPPILVAAWVAQQLHDNGVSEFVREIQGLSLLILGLALFGLSRWTNSDRRLRALYEIAKSHERARS